MTYIPEWESLAQSLSRIQKKGGDAQAIKADLCNAIADKKIKLRFFLSDEDEFLPGYSFSGAQIQVPRRLKPADFDWDASQPIKNWSVGTDRVDETGWEQRKCDLLEVWTDDVNAALNILDLRATEIPPKLKSKIPKLSKVAKMEKFKEWREAREENVPTASEDIAHMKQFGVGRDEVRKISKCYPRLARGRPREK